MSIGENIRTVRKRNGLTIKQLAEKLYMSEQAISQYERDLRTPNTKLIFKIANILKVTPEELDPSIKEMANIWDKFDKNIDVEGLKKELSDIDLSVIPTKDLIEELNKRNDFKLTSKSSL